MPILGIENYYRNSSSYSLEMDQASIANGELPGFCPFIVVSLPQESGFFHVLMGLFVRCAEARRGLGHKAVFVEGPGLLDIEERQAGVVQISLKEWRF